MVELITDGPKGHQNSDLQEKREEQQQDEEMETSTNQNGQTETPPPVDTKPSSAALPLPPYDPETPVGENVPPRLLFPENSSVYNVLLVSRSGAREDGILLPHLLPVLHQREHGQEDALQQPGALRQAAGEPAHLQRGAAPTGELPPREGPLWGMTCSAKKLEKSQNQIYYYFSIWFV